ncbi:hypothetical protein FA13DRAFT_1734239 [Coprinellus micaceus]|uniref:Uncharacterized protein n=1 Tax=Coprinellus micaceus TaxID=71717 RepID=A0A4Y7T7F5_COPMI|nr:hypothetical protein FA13DRAFT_1734239 [Coprinellus micaceus]
MERYSALLSSNSAPEFAEIVAIQDDIKARAKTIDKLYDEQARIKKELVKALEEYHALRGLASPLRRFPAEILSEIFMIVYDSADCHSYYDPRKTTHRVVDLCRVSKRWRDAAIGTPRLWRSIILLPLRDGSYLDIGKISTWMGRSENIARHLEFRELNRCHHWQGEGGPCLLLDQWLLGKLLSEGPLLDSLHLNGVYPECLQELAKHVKGQHIHVARAWDSLKDLTLSLACRRATSLTLDLSNLPLARSFHLRQYQGYPISLEPAQSSPANDAFLLNLTSLNIRGTAIPSVFALLRSCTGLRDLTVDPHRAGSEFPRDQQPCLLPDLRTLRLERWTYEQVESLPTLLRTPGLIDLHIRFAPRKNRSEDDRTEDRCGMVAAFTSFVERSEATVQRLHIEGLSISSRGMQRMLINAPSVVNLTIYEVEGLDATHFLPSTNPASEDCPLLLPRLTSLRVGYTFHLVLAAELCDTFARRVTRYPTFKALNLELNIEDFYRYDTVRSSDLRDAVSRLRGLGVAVSVGFKPHK